MMSDFLSTELSQYLHSLPSESFLPFKVLFDSIESPSKSDMGDRAIPCFSLAKSLKKAPALIAKEFEDALRNTQQNYPLPALFASFKTEGPYLNFFANTALLAKVVIEDCLLTKCLPTKSTGKKIIVEFSSPNIAKPFSIGHLRSTNIGASIARMTEARGNTVIRMNHLGDWGTQFGKMLCAFKMWGSKDLGTDPLKTFLDLYVRFHKEEETKPELSDQAREWFSKLEKGDGEAQDLWQWFKTITLLEVETLYKRLGIRFDYLWGESHYIHLLPSLMLLLENHRLLQNSQEATIVDLKDHKLGVAVIKKRDESSLYVTRDLAAAIHRFEEFQFDSMLYVVGMPQSLHFQQLFKILELTGHPWVKSCEHIAFGHIGFGDESMSTRKGNIVFLNDVLNEAKDHAKQLIEEKNPNLENKDLIAEQVGLGAILFADISARRIKDVHFSWKDILKFEGDTGPYLQYSYVRIRSVFAKAAHIQSDGSVQYEKLSTSEEAALVRTLSDFSKCLERADLEREPFILGSYLLDLCKAFNRFYAHCKIIDSENPDMDVSKVRLQLVKAVEITLKRGMDLLGIPTPERM